MILRHIPPPPRSGRAGSVIIVLGLGFSTTFALLSKTWFGFSAGGAGLLLLAAVRSRDPMAIHVSLLAFLMTSWQPAWPAGWPLYLLCPFLLYMVVAVAVPPFRKTLGWPCAGRFDPTVGLLIAATILLSSGALVVWFLLSRPDVGRWVAAIPAWPVPLLVVAGLGFSVLNAVIEEAIYRGVLMQALDAVFGVGYLSVVLQAVPFGLVHLAGVPNGVFGAGMAGVYGLMLGLIRRRARGMLAPIATHVLADVVIFTMLALRRSVLL
jgi:membrane protease YdiL (CAAX protease family)